MRTWQLFAWAFFLVCVAALCSWAAMAGPVITVYDVDLGLDRSSGVYLDTQRIISGLDCVLLKVPAQLQGYEPVFSAKTSTGLNKGRKYTVLRTTEKVVLNSSICSPKVVRTEVNGSKTAVDDCVVTPISTEVQSTYSVVPYVKGLTNETAYCFQAPLERTGTGVDYWATVTATVNGVTYGDFQHSSWFNNSYLRRKVFTVTPLFTDTGSQAGVQVEVSLADTANYSFHTGGIAVDERFNTIIPWFNATPINNGSTGRLRFRVDNVTYNQPFNISWYYDSIETNTVYECTDVDKECFRLNTPGTVAQYGDTGTSGTWAVNTTYYYEDNGAMSLQAAGAEAYKYEVLALDYVNATFEMYMDILGAYKSLNRMLLYADSVFQAGIAETTDQSSANFSVQKCDGAWQVTTVPLSQGWHAWKWETNDTHLMYVDGVPVYSCTKAAKFDQANLYTVNSGGTYDFFTVYTLQSGRFSITQSEEEYMPNMAPSADYVTLQPVTAYNLTSLQCVALASDYENDSLTYYYNLTVNGAYVAESVFSGQYGGNNHTWQIESANYSKGDNVSCNFTAYDGIESSGTINSGYVTILNSVPGTGTFTVPANSTTALNISVDYTAVDDDNDTLQYYLVFDYVNGSHAFNATTNLTHYGTNASSGEYRARFYSCDTVSCSGWSSWITLHVEGLIKVSAYRPLNNSVYYIGDTITFGGEANLSGLAQDLQCNITVNDTGGSVTAEYNLSVSGAYLLDVPALTLSNKSYTVCCESLAGQEACSGIYNYQVTAAPEPEEASLSSVVSYYGGILLWLLVFAMMLLLTIYAFKSRSFALLVIGAIMMLLIAFNLPDWILEMISPNSSVQSMVRMAFFIAICVYLLQLALGAKKMEGV